jgi:uncharacterized protein (DUF305 family)
MRPRTLMIGLVLLLVLGATTALSLRRMTPATAQLGPMSPVPLEQQSGDAFDRAWLQQMIMHHAMAVMMAQPVAAGAPHDELRDLANAITADQTREIAQMRAWLRDWYGVSMPDPVAMMTAMHAGQMPMAGMGVGMMPGHMGAMDAPHMGMMGHGPMMPVGAATMPHHGLQGMGMGMHDMGMIAHLATLPGPRLEAVFMVMMIPHHEDAIEMANLALDRAAHDELKALAQAIITSQSGEIEQMNRWLADWYGL